MLVKLLHHVPNFEQLSLEVYQLISKAGPNHSQIMCQTSKEGLEDLFTGTGKVEELPSQDETVYKYIQPGLQGTLIESIIREHRAFRTRIMIMPGRHSYSVHKDLTPRIHVPILTNPQAWMIWPFDSVCTRLSAGMVYWTDTTKQHTFLNGSLEQRIHLVMCVND